MLIMDVINIHVYTAFYSYCTILWSHTTVVLQRQNVNIFLSHTVLITCLDRNVQDYRCACPNIEVDMGSEALKGELTCSFKYAAKERRKVQPYFNSD